MINHSKIWRLLTNKLELISTFEYYIPTCIDTQHTNPNQQSFNSYNIEIKLNYALVTSSISQGSPHSF